MAFSLETLNVFAQIVFIDLVLAGDNAIIVGMVAARVPMRMRRKVILFGVDAAVLMRIGFSLIAVQLLSITGLKLLGGALLLWVCWRLWRELRSNYGEAVEEGAEQASAAAAGGSSRRCARPSSRSSWRMLLVFGLALPVAFMIFAATLIAKLLKRYPWVAWLGVALILWVALMMMWEGTLEVLSVL